MSAPSPTLTHTSESCSSTNQPSLLSHPPGPIHSSHTDVSKFAGKRLGVDAYVWLHRGAIACATQLCTSQGSTTTLYVNYILHRVRMLLYNKVIPVLVFDGADLPMKAAENGDRRKRRKEAMRNGTDALASGDKKLADAEFIKAVEITPEMAHEVIRQLRKINVEYVVAPYEADAQLTWMINKGDIDGVITEDSDLVAYGAKSILYKMNKFGEAQLVRPDDLGAIEDPNMRRFTPEMFLWVCVLSGCDFFSGVNGLGLKKGHEIVKRYRRLPRVLNYVKFNRKYNVNDAFATNFYRACLVFRHQTVYDCETKSLTHLKSLDAIDRNDIPPAVFGQNGDDYDFLGPIINTSIAQKVAESCIHPFTLEEYDMPLDDVHRPMPRVRHQRISSVPKRARIGGASAKLVERRSKYWKDPIKFKVKQRSPSGGGVMDLLATYTSTSARREFRTPSQGSTPSPVDDDEEMEDRMPDQEAKSLVLPAFLQNCVRRDSQDEAKAVDDEVDEPQRKMPTRRVGLSLRPLKRSKSVSKKPRATTRKGSLSLANKVTERTKKLGKTALKRPRHGENIASFLGKRAKNRDNDGEETYIPEPPSPPGDLDSEKTASQIEGSHANTPRGRATSSSQSKPGTEEPSPPNVQDSGSLFGRGPFRSPFLRGGGTERITLASGQDKRRQTKNLVSLLGASNVEKSWEGEEMSTHEDMAVEETPPTQTRSTCRTEDSARSIFRQVSSALEEASDHVI